MPPAVSLALDGDGLGTVWGEQLATEMLTVAGFVIFAPGVWLFWYNEHHMLLAFMPLLVILTVSLLFLVYTAVSEWQWGQTVGKYLLAVRAVRESGARISQRDADRAVEAVVRHLPVILQVFWIDVLFALFTEKSQRAFELLSKTRVVLVPPSEVR